MRASLWDYVLSKHAGRRRPPPFGVRNTGHRPSRRVSQPSAELQRHACHTLRAACYPGLGHACRAASEQRHRRRGCLRTNNWLAACVLVDNVFSQHTRDAAVRARRRTDGGARRERARDPRPRPRRGDVDFQVFIVELLSCPAFPGSEAVRTARLGIFSLPSR